MTDKETFDAWADRRGLYLSDRGMYWEVWQEAVKQEREAYREIVTLYQHSAMTDAEFVLRMIDFIEERSRTVPVPAKE